MKRALFRLSLFSLFVASSLVYAPLQYKTTKTIIDGKKYNCTTFYLLHPQDRPFWSIIYALRALGFSITKAQFYLDNTTGPQKTPAAIEPQQGCPPTISIEEALSCLRTLSACHPSTAFTRLSNLRNFQPEIRPALMYATTLALIEAKLVDLQQTSIMDHSVAKDVVKKLKAQFQETLGLKPDLTDYVSCNEGINEVLIVGGKRIQSIEAILAEFEQTFQIKASE